ncbi:hypothetical protein NDU88_003589 [Pleurodeles waltl]|uniref:Uncharacterized protein n=1 Tax=Pleurodeles waltl TaxID=8319 RepID=A0AAV7Q9T8_PLEWA|nr:hypothetical protein NDU88_003589 [Pleurodeles waltl]
MDSCEGLNCGSNKIIYCDKTSEEPAKNLYCLIQIEDNNLRDLDVPDAMATRRGKHEGDIIKVTQREARAVLKEYPGVLKDPLAPSDSCGVSARAVQEQCSGVLGNPLTLSDSCGSVARAVPSVLAGGAC